MQQSAAAKAKAKTRLPSFCTSASSGVEEGEGEGEGAKAKSKPAKQTNLGEILLSLSLLPYWGVSKLLLARFRTKRNGNGIVERCRCLHKNQKQLQRQQHFCGAVAFS